MDMFSKMANYIRVNLGLPPLFVTAHVLNKQFIVRKGGIRATADKDDAWLLALAAHSRSVFDIGSNVGQAAFTILYFDTVERLYMVEANPRALSIAAENLIYNKLIDRTQLVCSFVSDTVDKSVQFWTVGTGAASSIHPKHAKTASSKNSYLQLNTTTVDHLCNQFQVNPNLVKIDVEGAEADVLNGSMQCAAKQQTRFFVEMHSNPDLPIIDNANKILSWCNKCNYKAWYLSRKVELTEARQLADRGRCHVLLQPAVWEYPDWLKKIDQGSPLNSVIINENSTNLD